VSTPNELSLPPLERLSPQEVRQRLAGLIDPAEAVTVTDKETYRLLAVEFCAALPAVFGDTLDRMTLWDRIASGIQSGYAKTVSGDLELFVQHVLEHIRADASRVVACDRICSAQERLFDLSTDDRQAFLTYLVTHLIPVLVFARKEWKLSAGGAR
jgi:hypothetical protein